MKQVFVDRTVNPLIATLKPHSNGPSYSNTVIGTLAVELLSLKIYLIILKHIKSLILLKKLVFISNFNVLILMFVVFFYSSLIALILHS